MSDKQRDEEKKVLRDLETGNFRISTKGHPGQRMGERSVSQNDIMKAARRYKSCFQQSNGKWRIEGPDLDNDDLTIICIVDNGETFSVSVY